MVEEIASEGLGVRTQTHTQLTPLLPLAGDDEDDQGWSLRRSPGDSSSASSRSRQRARSRGAAIG